MSMQPQTTGAGGCHDGSVTANAAIVVNDLSKAYGAHEAVRGLTFSVRRGEVYGLLGPNGAGKTTTVEILEGHRRRDGGEVSVLGHDPAERAVELRSRVGIVLQSCGTYPHLTVRETLEHFARLYPAPRGVDETIALAGLEEAADRRARTLSGGQQRRLDLALALVGDPELIFLDEPTTGFDPAARRAAWEVVRALRDLGKTVLLTTHYLDEAQALADRVAIVKDGRDPRRGPPGELIAGAARYRVSYRRGDELVEVVTEDPTTLLHEATAAALARGERLEELSVSRPSLEDVYLELTAEAWEPEPAAHDGARLAPVPARAPDVLAQPDGRVLQLPAAAAAAGAVRRRVRGPTRRTST